jgi:hypothetical protein
MLTPLRFAPKHTNSLASANLLANRIPAKQAQELISIMGAKENLVTLCGLEGTETQLDLSGKGLGAGCAVLLAHEMKDMGALVSLNLAHNNLVQGKIAMKQARLSKYNATDMSGVIALATALPKWYVSRAVPHLSFLTTATRATPCQRGLDFSQSRGQWHFRWHWQKSIYVL